MTINFKFVQAMFLSVVRIALVVWVSMSMAAAQLAMSNAPMFVTEIVKPNVFISPVYAAPYNEVSLLDPPWSEYRACVAGTLSGDVCTELTSSAWTLSAMFDQNCSLHCTTATRLTPWPGAYKATGALAFDDGHAPVNVLLSEITLFPFDVVPDAAGVAKGFTFDALFYHYSPSGSGFEAVGVKEEPYPEAIGNGIVAESTSIGKLRYFRSDKNFLYFNKEVADNYGYSKWSAVGDWPTTSLPTYDSAVSQAFYNPLKLVQGEGESALDILADLDGGTSWGFFGPVRGAWVDNITNPTGPPVLVNNLIGQYWVYKTGTDVWKADSYDGVQWNGMNAAEKVNFANWFTYWRNSYLATRGMLANLMHELGPNRADVLDKFRIGLHVDNAAGNNSELRAFGLSNTDDILNAVGQAIYSFDTNFTQWTLNRLVNAASPTTVNGYLTTEAPYRDEPSVVDSPLRACRRNYEIIISPDYTLLRFDKDDLERTRRGGLLRNYSNIDADGDGLKQQFSDAGMMAWKTDLIASLPNVLLPGKQDEATWQHLVRFIIAPKAKGVIFNSPPYDSTSALNKFSQLTTADWLAAYGTDATRDEFLWSIDDLWHMALNSRGFFYQTNDVREMTQSILSAFNDVLVRNVSGSAVAANTTSLQQGGMVYQATVESDWKGHLRAFQITPNEAKTALVLDYATPVWDLAQTVSNTNWNSRKIVTAVGQTGVSFQWSSTGIQDVMKANLPGGIAGAANENVYAEKLLQYLRGDGSCEQDVSTSCNAGVDFSFRRRNLERGNYQAFSADNPNGRNVLGDISNSNPWLTTAPVGGLSDVDYPGYNQYRKTNKDRADVLFVGANDGMLHAIKADHDRDENGNVTTANGGMEYFAYIPSFVLPNLYQLASANYAHKYFTDGSPFTADAMVGSGWKTVLASGANRGGKGYFALDVTDPIPSNESQAVSKFLWEFTHATDMHYTFNLPVPNANGQARQIVRMNNGNYALVVGNGYPDASGKKACLFILYLTGPGMKSEDDTEGNDYHGSGYHKICAGATSYGDGGLNTNGLSTPTPVDVDNDGAVDIIYAGDLNGNVWKFDVSNANPTTTTVTETEDDEGDVTTVTTVTNNWVVAYSGAPIFVAKNNAGNRQSIIAPIEVTTYISGPVPGYLLLFGTGRYLSEDDMESTEVETFYGVWDRSWPQLARANLLARTVTESASLRTIGSTGPVQYCVTDSLAACDDNAESLSYLGWYWDMPTSGERMTGRVNLINYVVFFNTFFPATETYDDGGVTKTRLDPCQYGGDGWLMALNAVHGTMEQYDLFSQLVDDPVTTDVKENIAAGVKVGAALGGTTFARGLQGNRIGIYSPTNLGTHSSEGNKMTMQVSPGDGTTGRVSWYELMD